MTSTLSTSIQVRTMLEPTSGLFWWSALRISTLSPLAAASKSSTARRAATTEPGPVRSAYSPDMSFITPILMVPSVYCACAVPDASTPARMTRAKRRFIGQFLRCCSCRLPTRHSDPKIVVELCQVRVQFGIGALIDHLAVFHDIVTIRHRGGEA